MRQCHICADYISIGTTCDSCREKSQKKNSEEINLNTLKVEFGDSRPKEPGDYLWQSTLGLELIQVRCLPERSWDGGIIGTYLGVVNRNNRHIDNLQGKFSKKIET